MKLINDQYRKARGGWARRLKLGCSQCGKHFTDYQKDGSGVLKRLYLDRMGKETFQQENVTIHCNSCSAQIGIVEVYEKEDRPCIRLFVSSLKKL